MPTKIFVGRLVDGTTSEEIGNLFRKFGHVTECDVLQNFGFVHMESEEEAKAAIAALDGYSVNGSHIHVEMSTASTQGRKRRTGDNFRGSGRMGGDRDNQYLPRRDGYAADPGYRSAPPAAPPPERYAPREEYASDQVKDLLELYFRDPQAFDQYAKTYYYGERMERARAAQERRPPDAGMYPSSAAMRREEDMGRAPVYARPGYPSSGVDPMRSGISVRDERSRGMNAMIPPSASQTAYGAGRI